MSAARPANGNEPIERRERLGGLLNPIIAIGRELEFARAPARVRELAGL
ncbi:MAG TPA: hypothetical protein VH165_19665 [Kofleriaceae bacterium]|nr:hypothetical protein [Kofleriaceae bacterium]